MIIQLVQQILKGIFEIHLNDIIHRDMKPENIFLNDNKQKLVCKIGDFGLSRTLKKGRKFAMTVAGSPLYMAPELVNGQRYTNKVDIWSIGCILYELCTSEALFQDDELFRIMNNISKKEIKSLPPIYSRSLDTIFKRMVERNPDKRFTAIDILNSELFIKKGNVTRLIADNLNNNSSNFASPISKLLFIQ